MYTKKERKNNMKPKVPNIGQKIYTIHRDIGKSTAGNLYVKERTITGILVDEDGQILLNLDHKTNFQHHSYSSYFVHTPLNRNEMWFSPKKAENVLKQRIVKDVKEKSRRVQINLLQQELDKNKGNVEENYINKEVLVKVGGKEGWRRDKIKSIWTCAYSNDYTLLLKGMDIRANHYLLKKEGKTWMFFTEELKLQREKESLEKRLKDIEDKLQGLD